MSNIDPKTVASFGAEWSRFSQGELDKEEHARLFDSYFRIFPWGALPPNPEGFDMGCGSGRWAKLVAPRVGKLNCVDPSKEALEIARQNLAELDNVNFLHADVSGCQIPPCSQDFGYSLGVLHHIPETKMALRNCVELLKPGAPFLVYLYYRFDNKPRWYAWAWKCSNMVRLLICKLPDRLKAIITDLIAGALYYPFARSARLAERCGIKVDNWILSSYRNCSFYTMRTDSRDRFGTPLEQRFTRSEIKDMMVDCGLERICFSDRFPFWCAVGSRKKTL